MESSNECPECGSVETYMFGDKVVERGEYTFESCTKVSETHDKHFVGEIECRCMECGYKWVKQFNYIILDKGEGEEAKDLLRRLVNDFKYAMDPYSGLEDQAWCTSCEAKWGPDDEWVHEDDCLWKGLLDFLDMYDPFLP